MIRQYLTPVTPVNMVLLLLKLDWKIMSYNNPFLLNCLVFPRGGFLVQRSLWGRVAEMGLKINLLHGITMTPYLVQKLV